MIVYINAMYNMFSVFPRFPIYIPFYEDSRFMKICLHYFPNKEGCKYSSVTHVAHNSHVYTSTRATLRC